MKVPFLGCASSLPKVVSFSSSTDMNTGTTLPWGGQMDERGEESWAYRARKHMDDKW